MRIIVISISIVLFVSNICLVKLDSTDVNGLKGTENGVNPIDFTLIADDRDGPNTFNISYEVSYDEFVFKRFEKCHIIEVNNTEDSVSGMVCSGETKFSRTGDVKNITNFDNYTYSTSGFYHAGEEFITHGNYIRLNKIDVYNAVTPALIFVKLNHTTPVKKLQFEHIGNNTLRVNLTITSTFFTMNRTEIFSAIFDNDTNANDFACDGKITLTVKNSDDYNTVQKEYFSEDEEFSYIYINEVDPIESVTSVDLDDTTSKSVDPLKLVEPINPILI